MLISLGYRGFANFDIKRNATTGKTVFIEANPPIGRNSYYVTAAGQNPLDVCVDDLIYDTPREPISLTNTILYTLVPHTLLKHYLDNPELRRKVERLISQHKTMNPLYNPCDCRWREISPALTK